MLQSYFYWSCVYKYIIGNAWVSALPKNGMLISVLSPAGYFLFFYSEFDFFFFDDLQLPIIANISPKASVENSSAQWAIFFFIKGAQGIPHMEYWSTHSTGHNQLSHTWNIDAPTVQGTINHPPHGILICPHVVQGTINHPPTWNIGPPTVQSTINHPPHGILIHPQYRAQSTIPHMEYWSAHMWYRAQSTIPPGHGILICQQYRAQSTIPPTWNIDPPTVQGTINHPPTWNIDPPTV